MARKNGPTPDEFEALSRYGSGRAEVDDYTTTRSEFDAGEVLESARMADMEPEPESPFLRAQKRVPVRRGPLAKKAANRLKIAIVIAGVVGITAAVALGLDHYAMKSWRFRIDTSDQVAVSGNENVTRGQVLDIFGGDISRNLFAVPLEERRQQIEKIPWVESATVMRQLPNRLAVVIKERTPVAFAEVGSRIALVDSNGVVMEMSGNGGKTKYSFPVLVGFTDAEPLSTRAARMKIYTKLVHDLDSGGARYSQDVSEVDLSDPEDAKVTVGDSGILVHLGNANYLDRYKIYVSHVQEWRQQFGTISSVDLRYEGQVVVDPGSMPQGPADAAAPAASTPAKAKPAKAVAKRKTYARSHWRKRR